MLVDSHCHLDFNDFGEDFEEVLARAKEAGVEAILNAGNNLNELAEQLKISEKYPFIYTAAGVHPHNASDYENLKAIDIIKASEHKKVIAIGECGLDYYYDHSPKDVQKKLFIEHIKAAQENGLPLIIHARDADDDIIEIMEKEYKNKPFTGVIHCFSSSQKLADFALSLGFYLSASGIITFNKCREVCDVFEKASLDKLLIETDAPFLAPVPKRGRRNEPAFVKYTAERLAQIKDISLEELSQITSDNFFRLFRKASDKGRYDYK